MPRQYGITVLVSSHLLGEVEQMADKVGIIREGRMVFQDTIDNLVSTASSGFRLSVSEPELALGLALDREGVLRNQMLELESMQDAKIARS